VQVVDYKLSGSQIKSVGEKPGAPTYIKYTPSGGGGAHNSGASHRVIRMSEVQLDPLEPPKFRHKKVRSKPATLHIPQLSLVPMVRRWCALPVSVRSS
jgi:SNW domain-containing protein 1